MPFACKDTMFFTTDTLTEREQKDKEALVQKEHKTDTGVTLRTNVFQMVFQFLFISGE